VIKTHEPHESGFYFSVFQWETQSSKEGIQSPVGNRQGMVVAKGGKLLVAHPALSLGWKVRKQGSCRLQAFQGLCVARSTARLLPPTSPTAGPPHACTVLPCLAWLGTLHQGFPTGRAMHCCLCYMHGFMLLLQMNKGFTGTAVGCQQLNSTSVTSTF